MTTLITLCRKGTLSEGLKLSLEHVNDITPPELAEHVQAIFPQGLSRHGARFFAGFPTDENMARSGVIDEYVETVRRAWFPERPCRYLSMFAWETLAEAQQFAAVSVAEAPPRFFEVEAGEYFRADMRLLRLAPSVLMQSYLAHLYWRGEPAPASVPGSPIWELVVPLPVTIGRRVA